MRKYDIRICKCGRVHAIPTDLENEMIFSNGEKNKDIALVCGSCGSVVIIGADYGLDYYEMDESGPKYAYDCYSYDKTLERMTALTEKLFTKPTVILYDRGYGVPMMTGEYANFYSRYGAGFEDMTYPDFMNIEKPNTTMTDVQDFIAEYRKNRKTVNMDRFICDTPEDVLESLSCFMIDGLDWTGTKFDRTK